MAPETYAEEVARALLKLGVTNRLKGAPKYHLAEIGENKANIHTGLTSALVAFQSIIIQGGNLTSEEDKALAALKALRNDPEIDPYTPEKIREDEEKSAGYPLRVDYRFGEDVFKLTDAVKTTQQIRDHFLPINWEEFRDYTDWELIRDVIPSMSVAKVGIEIYKTQRWLYDERSQRAAETLAYRIEHIYNDKQLPEYIPTTEQQIAIFGEYADRLSRGVNARRWLQNILTSFASKSRAARRAAVEGER